MNVETTITRRDLLVFNLTVIPRLRIIYFYYLVLVGTAFLSHSNSSGFPVGLSDWVVTIGLSFFVAFILLVAVFLIVIVLQVVTASTSSGVIGPHEYVVTQDGFRDRTPQTDSMMKWSFIKGVVVTRSYALIKVSRACFYIVPKRSFSSQDDFDGFVSKIRSYWKS